MRTTRDRSYTEARLTGRWAFLTFAEPWRVLAVLALMAFSVWVLSGNDVTLKIGGVEFRHVVR